MNVLLYVMYSTSGSTPSVGSATIPTTVCLTMARVWEVVAITKWSLKLIVRRQRIKHKERFINCVDSTNNRANCRRVYVARKEWH